MFYITELPDQPGGYVRIATSTQWEQWVRACLSDGLDQEVRTRLVSNLKHVLVALELKAALITPHAQRENAPAILFEPYYHMMNFEFCVGVFSICEGLGSANWLLENGLNGAAANLVGFNNWKLSLVNAFDPIGEAGLNAGVDVVKSVRDKLHQDRLGARESVDWHAFSYEHAFIPAIEVLQCLLLKNEGHVPEQTNLRAG